MSRIETNRLILRRLQVEDATRFHECIQDPNIHRNLGTVPADQSFERTRERIIEGREKFDSGSGFSFAITEDGAQMIGLVGGGFTSHASLDLGYWVAGDASGKGYVTEAARGLMDWAIATHGVKAFTAGYVEDNPASGRVLSKLGFMHAGRSRYFVQGRQEWCWSRDMAKIV